MRTRAVLLLLCISLCLAIPVTADEPAGSSKVTITQKELSPGYYICAVWDGDTLLTLFDTTVGSDGVLSETVEVGKELKKDDKIQVGISGENANAEPVRQEYVVNSSGGITPAPSTPAKPSPGSSGSSSGSHGSSSKVPLYTVTVEKAAGGTVSSSAKSIRPWHTVTLTITPDMGYKLSTLSIQDQNGNSVELTKDGTSECRFRMPASNVTVRATFVQAGQGIIPSSTYFADVPNNAYYLDAVKWAEQNGITTTKSGGRFKPDASCTRAEIVTFLWRAAGSPGVTGTPKRFKDVSDSAYYADAVDWASSQKIAKGMGSRRFAPDAPVTRAQAVTFLWRAAGSPSPAGAGKQFKDVSSGAYYQDAVRWASGRKIAKGIGSRTFAPDRDVTRAQTVTFLYRSRTN